MSIAHRLDMLSMKTGGVLHTRDVLAAGISKASLLRYVDDKAFERVSHGIYIAPDAWKDELYLLSLRCPQAVFSHETALFLHDLCDREPLQNTATFKTGYNPSKLTAEGIKVYTVKASLYPVGVSKAATSFGHTVPVYDMERTICDILRSRSTVDMQSFQSALKQYARRRDKNLSHLAAYAKAFRVERILRPYMEVLL